MVKNTVTPRHFDRVHVKLVHKKRHTSHKAKIISIDNYNNQPRVYGGNMSDVPTSATRTSDIINLPVSIQNKTFPSPDLLIQQDKKTSNYRQLSSTSIINRSEVYNSTKENTVSILNKKTSEHKEYIDHFERKNLSCKNVLKILAICLLGLFVILALILPNVFLYLMMPSIFPTPVNQTNLTEPIIYANHYAGASSYSKWNYYTGVTTGIYMIVNTANCSFNNTPLYYTSIVGDTLRTDFIGYNAIYTATKTYFVIYMRSYGGWDSAQMLNYSQIEKWNLSWIGIYH